MKAVCKRNVMGSDILHGYHISKILFKKGEVYDYYTKISSNYTSGYYGVISDEDIEETFNTIGFREYFTTVQELRKLKLEKINNV